MHPLEGTLSRLGSAGARLSLTAPPGRRTVPADRLARPGAELNEALRTYTETVEAGREVSASQFSKHWAVSVARAALAAFAAERRAPDVSAANTRVVLDDSGRPVGLRMVEPRFAVLPDDPASHSPTATVVPDVAALGDWLRATMLDGHLTGVVDAMAAVAPMGRQRLWGNVAAAGAGAFTALSGREIPAERLMADATAFLDAPGAPTCGLVELYPLRDGGRERLFARRQTCCLRYRLRQAPVQCLSCPLLSEPERRERAMVRLGQPEA